MLLWILLLLLILLGFGIPLLILWYAAVLLLAIWILSFAVRGGSRSAHGHQWKPTSGGSSGPGQRTGSGKRRMRPHIESARSFRPPALPSQARTRLHHRSRIRTTA